MTQAAKSYSGARIAIATLAIALTLVLFWPAFRFAWMKWGTDPNYGHGYFVPLAAGYLIWRKKAQLALSRLAPSVFGLALVAPAVLLHSLASRAELLRLSMVAFVVVVAGLVVLFAGWTILRQVSFALLFLLLAVPVPLFLESITLPMKIAASAAAVQILTALGHSVYREGTIIHLSNLSLEVATACSGIRSLVLVCTIGTFYSYVSQTTLLRRGIVLLSSIPIALCANVARIVVTAWLSNYPGAESLREMIHDFSGAFVFVVAGGMFIVVGAVVDEIWYYAQRRTQKAAQPQTDVAEALPTGSDSENT